ncbi:FUSC family protein, partial [Streptomyces sp. NPDC005904]
AAAWWPLVVAVERILDATTAARVRIRHGAPPAAADEITEIARELRELAAGLRASDVLEEVRPDFTVGPKDSVLEPLRQEVAAARAIATPKA